jgi:two-component system, sensor histidine kinase and response regulator
MSSVPRRGDEDARLAALRAYEILDTAAEADYDEIVRLAAQACRAPLAAIGLVDAQRTWFKAQVGFDAPELTRDSSFCAHTVVSDDLQVVEDAADDDRFRGHQMVAGEPHIRFYAGVPLITPEGQHVGALCIADVEPRKLKAEQAQALRWLGRHTTMLLELRRKASEFRKASAERERAESALRSTASLSRSAKPAVDTADRWRFWPAVVALVGGLLLTALAARIAWGVAMRGEEERFAGRAERITALIGQRLRGDAAVLDAAAALWTAQHEPATSEWDRFFKTQSAGGRRRGLLGLGFVEVVPRSGLAAFNARGKAEYGEGFRVNPEPEGDVAAYAIRMIAPAEIARAGVGLNIAATEGRRVTAEKARDEGHAVMTPPTSFDGRQLDVILYRPVYRPGMPLDTVGQRRAAHLGWTYGLVRVADLIEQAPLDAAMSFRLSDGAVLYATSTPPLPLPFRLQRRMPLLGRNWIASIEGSPDERLVRREAEMVLVAGVPITLLLVVMVVVLNSTRRRALAIAADMTRGLRDSELRIRSIVDHIADAVVAFHDDGSVAAFNPAAERLFRHRPSDILGRDVGSILPTIRRTAADGTSVRTAARRSDGSEIAVELAVKPVPDDDRNLNVAIVRDVSERVTNEERLRASEERYRDLFENSNDLILSVDLEGRIVFANRAWFRTLGYDESELQTMTMRDILDADAPLSCATCTHQSAECNSLLPLPWCTRLAEMPIQSGECVDCEGVETVFVARDGRRIHVEGNMSCRFDEHGRPLSMRGIWRDITARKGAERELRASQERLQSLIENADDVIYRADARGRFTFVNATASRVTGYDKQQLMGMSYLNLVRPDYCDAVKQFYEQQHLDQVSSSYLEFPIIAADGRELWLGQKVQPVLGNGGIAGYHGLARDVTDRKRLKDELVLARDAALESAELKSQFLATMSHEIRTPMNGVIGMLGILLETDLTTEQREIATTVQTSADLLLTIINDILDYSKIESGKLIFERNEFDLVEVVDGSVDLLAEPARAKSLSIAVIIEHDVPTRLRGDAGRLRQVLINLIGNAVKFTERGAIVVFANAEGESENAVILRFAISDSGIGIEPDVVKRLFMPFAQADGSMARRFGGTGLGLAICKQLVEQMNGTIGVDSQPGQGSTFWFTAELEKQPLALPEPLPLDASTRILIIDDQDFDGSVFRRQVAALGVRTEMAATTEQALTMLRDARAGGDEFRACIVDLHVPEEEQASAFAAAVRAEGPAIPLILVTGLGRWQADIDAWHAAGFEHVLTRPVRQSHLRDCLADALRIRKESTAPAPAATTQAQPRRLRVLVAEDNRVNQQVVISQLRKLGHTAVAVGNGLEALAALDEIDYDAVLMDCQMPEMDGYEAATIIRRRRKSKILPIIAMTAHAMAGDRERCLDAGMDDYIAKPFKVEQLAEVLSRASSVAETAPSAEACPNVLDESVLAELCSIDSDPEFFPRVIALYLEDAPGRMDDLRRAIAARDNEAMWRAAHAFKGACANVGARRVVDLCSAIEREGRNGSSGGAPVLFAALESEFREAAAALEHASRAARAR